jgi:hypothetical protein
VLEDEPYAVWAQDLRRTYEGRVLGAHLDAAEAALAELDFAAALAQADAAAALDRFSERAVRTEMLALYALGRQHEALEIYRRFRARLDEELGLQATPETRALESAILRQEDVRILLPRPILPSSGDAGENAVRLLGRTVELDLIERSVRQALDRSFALIQIDGEYGLGKTRLLDELATTLVGVRVGRAGCSELERHLPYVPLAAALRDALRGVQPDVGQLPSLRRILPELSLDEPAREFAEVDALEALVELIAMQGPMVLLIDDFQWADPQTVAAVSYLQRRARDVPAALVTAVATEQARADHPVRRLNPAARVHLEPLSAAELAPLGIPDLQESTGGNPRFVTVAIANGSRDELTAALAETLLNRCRAEGGSSYRLLLAASALEQPFDPEPLATLLRADAAGLIEEVEHLCERRILRVDGLGFRFRYQLVRDVLRASLSPARQRLFRERLDQRVDRSPAATGHAARAA